MLRYLRDSLRRKKARRITREYPARVDVFDVPGEGRIEFANWENPLVRDPVTIDAETVGFFRRYIAPGDLVVDIGANIGDTTVPMALAAGREGLTLGLDPNPYVFKILERNAQLNPDRTHIVPLPFAVSSREEDLYFVSSEASFANGGVSPTPESAHGRFVHPETVRAVRLRDLLERHFAEWLPRLSFIKIDAEGHDAVILESIQDLVGTYRPTVVAEVFDQDSPEGKARLYRALARPGYELTLFRDFDDPDPPRPVGGIEDLTTLKTMMNVCATPVGAGRGNDERTARASGDGAMEP